MRVPVTLSVGDMDGDSDELIETEADAEGLSDVDAESVDEADAEELRDVLPEGELDEDADKLKDTDADADCEGEGRAAPGHCRGRGEASHKA